VPRPPYTIVAFVAIVAAVLVAVVVAHGVDGWLLGGGLVLLVASLGLMRGIWLAWLFLTVVAAGDLVVALSRWPWWWPAAVNAALLALLLAPPTRRYAHRRRHRPGV
jgi:membrane protein implicated in regulation of membrane protease activity